MLFGPIVVALVAGYVYLTGGRYESTDDAYVQAARVAISANVAGRVSQLDVRDNQIVHKGDVLFRLDDAPFRIAVDEASAQLAAARLQIESLKANYRQRQSELRLGRGHARRSSSASPSGSNAARLGHRLAGAGRSRRRTRATRRARRWPTVQQQIGAVVANLGGNPNIAADRHPTVQQAQARSIAPGSISPTPR